jgi:hypothetical protein
MRRSAELLAPVRDAWEINIQKQALEPVFNVGQEIENSAWSASG